MGVQKEFYVLYVDECYLIIFACSLMNNAVVFISYKVENINSFLKDIVYTILFLFTFDFVIQ